MRGICPFNKHTETNRIIKLKAFYERIVKKLAQLLTMRKSRVRLLVVVVTDGYMEVLKEPLNCIFLSLHDLFLLSFSIFYPNQTYIPHNHITQNT